MDLFLKATTNVPYLIIDYIEVKLKSGKTVSLNWGLSDTINDGGGLYASYFELCFGEKRAKGSLKELKKLRVTDIGLYSDTCRIADISIKEMRFTEGDETLTIENAYSAEGVSCDG